jgi:Zn-dependent peptidase ImmA (M78 family)
VKRLWGLEKEDYYRSVASLYNQRIGVSVQAMQIRLEQLGLLREEVNAALL